MTLNQFRELASRKPDLNEECVYRYESFEISEISPAHPYPEFSLWAKDNILFKTFEEAVSYMRDITIRNTGAGHALYCHVITLIPWGKDTRIERIKFLYDHKGDLLDYTFTHRLEDVGSEVFFGRTPDRIRFKQGDFVEVRDDDTVRLGIIWHPETTVAECWDLYNNSDDKDDPYRGLSTADDHCVVIFGPGYDEFQYVSPTDMMAPAFNIDDNLRNSLMNCLKETIEKVRGFDEEIFV